MIFQKGDLIVFDDFKRECICADEDTAVFATFTPTYHKPEGKKDFVEDKNVVSYENLFAISNLDSNRDLINFEFVGGIVNG